MNYRQSFSTPYGAGRVSPYTSAVGQDAHKISDMVEYISSEDARRQTIPDAPLEEDNAPDVIHVRHLAKLFRAEFPAYSISEEVVKVAELRARVANHLNHDSRRIRLVYKDRDLTKDMKSLKYYGCKQNSEVAVVLTEGLMEPASYDNHSSEDDAARLRRPSSANDRRKPRGMSSVRHRDETDFMRDSPKTSATYLHPNGADYRPYDSRRRSPSPATTSRDKSPAPETRRPNVPQPTASPAPSSPRSPTRPPADPNSPMGKVQALQREYYDRWLPETKAFLRSPPDDAQQKDKEYRRLSECIMRHIIEAADAIELQGDQDARAERKKILNVANEMVKHLDSRGQ